MTLLAPIEREKGFWAAVRYWLGNWKLSLGLVLILSLVLFSGIGRLLGLDATSSLC